MPHFPKTSLQNFFSYCNRNNLPFAFYRLPQDKIVQVVAQKNRKLYTLTRSSVKRSNTGFLFAPFHETGKLQTILIRPDILCNENNLPELNFSDPLQKMDNKDVKEKILKEATKAEFISYIKEIQKEINSGEFKKVVAARILKRKTPVGFNVVKYFRTLCNAHPEALVSLVFTRQYGLWLGASPEVLLSVNDSETKTYSLAGTQQNFAMNGKTVWGKKEIEEQKIVSDYIVQTFKKISKHNPDIDGPVTISAGNLLHLRTIFTFKSYRLPDWRNIVKRLHPTPAVAGIPKRTAISFILKNEKIPRDFYGGYLGPVYLNNGVNLFVNIRCMKVMKKYLVVYAGCGITSASTPVAEWEETQTKADTLLSLQEK